MYYGNYEEANIGELVGQTLVSAEATNDSITFVTSTGDTYVMYHQQDCCEDVTIESLVGDLQDLVDAPILIAEEASGDTPADYRFEYEPESYTWTFYKFATQKGYVDIRWLGQSNGYYGESVDFIKVIPE